ncbi:Os06g0180050 [Oryza sativa Japonica Group]|uniref:Os06g0180050 protein n=1 Tax=Oryza sativa subsp. japonica TaxID=39947 RepID=A0A0P0WTK5_ORYSJ|nr:hypothetical protein EE612_032270 [Oryza sativa]BAS96458.1 Os06g0180050 [Oryza sativa Japonica Group]
MAGITFQEPSQKLYLFQDLSSLLLKYSSKLEQFLQDYLSCDDRGISNRINFGYWSFMFREELTQHIFIFFGLNVEERESC